jgi:hypothetical protein
MSQGTKGYIKLYRQIQDCWIWDSDEKHNRRSAWIDLLMLANHKDKKISFNDRIITIKRGQYLTSIRKLAERWKWSANTVSVFLKLLENDNMITKESDRHRTLLTIINYSIYQDTQTPTDTPTDTESETQTDTQGETVGKTPAELNNNDNNDKNDKEDIYIRKFEEVWKHYPRKEDRGLAYKCYKARLNDGYTEDELLKATIGYEEECKKNNREKRYIKKGSTFYGINTPFIDYLPKHENLQSIRLKNQTQEEITKFPYYGLPKEWFKGDMITSALISESVKDADTGEVYTPDDIIDIYYLRREKALGDEEDLELRHST